MNTETQISSKETYIRRHVYVLWYEKNIWYDHSKATCFWCLLFSYVREGITLPALDFSVRNIYILSFLTTKLGSNREELPNLSCWEMCWGFGKYHVCTCATRKFCIFEHYDMNILGENYLNRCKIAYIICD